MPITYQQTAEQEIHDRVRRKHGPLLAELKGLDFHEYYFFGETVGAFGFSPLGLSGFFGVLVALFKEVTRIERNLSVTLFNVALGSRDFATYAGPFGLGVKFYTGFTDGTCVITANFETPPIQDDRARLYKFARAQSIPAAWQVHRDWIEKLSAEGKQKSEPLSFAGFLKLVQREDEYLVTRRQDLMRPDF